MLSIDKIINAFHKTNEKIDDFVYAKHILEIIPSLKQNLMFDDKLLESINLTDKIANTNKLKRYRNYIAGIYIDIARNSIQLKHCEVEKIFHKAIEISSMDEKTPLQNFIIYEFNYGINNDNLKSLIDVYFSKFDKWAKDEKNKLIHAINICLKILDGNRKSALNWLNGYVKEFGTEGLQAIPLVSYFAYNNNIEGDLINKSAYIAGEVLRTRQDGLLERFLLGKTISIVGNGPQNIGTGLGVDIDKSDVVVRFNNGIVGNKYSKDYGTKSTIWVRNNAAPYGNFKNIRKCKFCILIDSIERMHWKDEQIKQLYEELIRSSCRLIAPTRSYLQGIFRLYDFSRFTSGSLAVAYILELIDHRKISVYGFSSIDETLKSCKSFYEQNKLSFFNDKSSNREFGYMNHSFEMEKRLMKDLFDKE